MPDARFAQFVERVGAFHLTDRAMLRAQRAIQEALAGGSDGARERAAYLHEVERYFTGFEREARAHLHDVDRRLEALNQVQFNLTAERAVAVKRIEATQSVLTDVRAIEDDGG